jgi:protoheme IX farnesyltransferase
VFTGLTGLVCAERPLHPFLAAVAIPCIAVGAGASASLNMWFDADIDMKMRRTRGRPVPSGRVQGADALGLGITLGLLSVGLMGMAVNWLAAFLLAFTIVFYAVVYTMWLKRWTPQNIVIGGAAGALPPVVAYAAATGTMAIEPWILFAIIFIWTPPHFWALALVKAAEYERAGVPMMPNAKGPDRTRTEILAYSLLLAPLGVAPWLMGFASVVYGVVAIIGGGFMIAYAVNVYRVRSAELGDKAAMKLFGVSILYLFALFGLLVIERSIPILTRMIGFGG